MVQHLEKTAWKFLKKFKIQLPYNPAILLLSICPKELKARSQRDTCTPMFVIALLTDKRWKQIKRPLTGQQINKMWHTPIHRMEYYLPLKKEEILPRAAVCMNLEAIMLSERSQSQKDCMILFIRDLKLNPNFTIFSLYDSKKIKLSIPSSSYPWNGCNTTIYTSWYCED